MQELCSTIDIALVTALVSSTFPATDLFLAISSTVLGSSKRAEILGKDVCLLWTSIGRIYSDWEEKQYLQHFRVCKRLFQNICPYVNKLSLSFGIPQSHSHSIFQQFTLAQSIHPNGQLSLSAPTHTATHSCLTYKPFSLLRLTPMMQSICPVYNTSNYLPHIGIVCMCHPETVSSAF